MPFISTKDLKKRGFQTKLLLDLVEITSILNSENTKMINFDNI